MARVIILDLEGDLGPPLTRLIESRGHQTKLTSAPQAANRELQTVPADLLLLNLPPRGYDERELSNLQPGDTPVLILHSGPLRTPPIGGSTRAYLVSKPFQSSDLLAGVESLCRPDTPQAVPPQQPRMPADFSFDPSGSRLYYRQEELALTPTEFALLSYLLQHSGRVVPHEELLERVWGFAPGSGGRDVLRAHVSNLRAKLPPQAQAFLRTVPSRGYLLAPE